ncbi:recombinase family protein [Streptomyces albus]|uniref:recombinase family protein n=1 Tax=Streptomyces sp. NRRL F-5639 TaxID=1463867 RepID=UPI0009966388|nr:recombinase family protein [Streptomyces sp. NRRL F-5639]
MVKRALGVVRLSVANTGQTGDDTQKKLIAKRVEADSLDLVGWAEDIDVSASLSPWLRPSLGDWLNNKQDQFDVLYVKSMDRIVRSVRDLCDIIDWCTKHGKSLICVEQSFDLTSEMGQAVAKILAVVAEIELNIIKSRVRASREAMRKAGRWPGGLVPFGRVAAKDGDGYTLAICPEYGPVLVEMIRLFMACKSFSVVADWLNAGNVPTVQDIARMRAAKGESTTRLNEEKAKARGTKWSPTSVQAVLTSRSLLGEYVRADGTVVRNEDGTPVMRSEPVLTEAEWLALQEVVTLVKYTKGPSETSPVRGILFCDGSDYEHPLYWAKGGKKNNKRPRIRCQGSKPKGRKPCPGHSFMAEELYELIGATLKLQIGSLPVRERRTVQDDSRAVKVAVLDAQLEQLTKELQAGKLSAAEYGQHVAKVAAEREAITSKPAARPQEQWVETGQTYADWWDSSTREERREKLLTWGVRVFAGPSGVRFEYGEHFPAAPLQVAQVGFGNAPAEAVSISDFLSGAEVALAA